tara:strand:+ start:373 stop:594 length:222 start_codon:yes stop_codon:yes gene_type:complete
VPPYIAAAQHPSTSALPVRTTGSFPNNQLGESSVLRQNMASLSPNQNSGPANDFWDQFRYSGISNSSFGIQNS